MSENKRPRFTLYLVVKDSADAQQGRWIPIGAAWPLEDGKGFSLNLDLLPSRMLGKHYSFVLWRNDEDLSHSA